MSLLDAILPQSPPEPTGARVVSFGTWIPPEGAREKNVRWMRWYRKHRKAVLAKRKAKGWK